MEDIKQHKSFWHLKKKTKHLELHFIYMFVIFTLFTAFLVTDRWTGKGDFTTYLTNVATFVSVVLGLVAIFYSFISNSSLSQSLGNISKVSEEIMGTKNQIAKFLEHADELEKSGSENAGALREISKSVESHVVSLKEALGSVTEKTQLLQESVGKKFEQLETKLIEANNDKVVKPGNMTGTKHTRTAEDLMQKSSIIGRFLMYGCVLANATEKTFSHVQFAKVVEFDEAYVHGFLVALIASNYIEKKDVEEDEGAFKIIWVDDAIKRQVKTVLVSKLEDKYKDDTKFLNRYMVKIEALEALFKG